MDLVYSCSLLALMSKLFGQGPQLLLVDKVRHSLVIGAPI